MGMILPLLQIIYISATKLDLKSFKSQNSDGSISLD